MLLKHKNNNVTFIPIFGVQQKICFPTIVNFPLSSTKLLNLTFLRSERVYHFSYIINKRIKPFRRGEINLLKKTLKKEGLNLYCDYTPMGYYNQDLAIINWYSSEGKYYDFDFLIFFEYDMFATKTIENLYKKYTNYDAGFIDYSNPSPSWYWYSKPPGARKALIKWLRDRGLKPKLYRCFFPGNMISRKVLENIEKIQLPYEFCEMRWPTVITGLGFKCVRLNFPMVRYKNPINKVDILEKKELGLFHPVYEDVDEIF
jgi:hypothetical protein